VGGSGGMTKGEIVVTTEAGSTVTCSNGSVTKSETAVDGTCIFSGLADGTWTIKATLDGETITETVVMDYPRRIFLMLISNIPAFSYTGDFEIVNDSDEAIAYSRDNWKIRFLSSGTLTFTKLNGATKGIDVFLVGGGGGGAYGGTFNGGGGGGYTTTAKGVFVSVNTAYEIVVGDGGEPETAGKASTAFGSTAKGGSPSYSSNSYYGGYGGNGGSGGGGGMMGGSEQLTGDGHGGADGENGSTVKHYEGTINGGTGQGTTTREFGESTGKLYAGGGGGGSWMNKGGSGGEGGGGNGSDYPGTPENGEPNTGGGGGGTRNGTGASGGSGIVIIRNKR
jgi:hypothetical protein